MLSFLKREHFHNDYQSLNQNSWHKINRLLVVLDHLSDVFFSIYYFKDLPNLIFEVLLTEVP